MGVNSYYVRDLDQVAWALKHNPTDPNLGERWQGIQSSLANQAAELKRIDGQIHVEADTLFKLFEITKEQK